MIPHTRPHPYSLTEWSGNLGLLVQMSGVHWWQRRASETATLPIATKVIQWWCKILMMNQCYCFPLLKVISKKSISDEKHKYSNVQLFKHSTIQPFKYANIQLLKYCQTESGTLLFKLSTAVQAPHHQAGVHHCHCQNHYFKSLSSSFLSLYSILRQQRDQIHVHLWKSCVWSQYSGCPQ